MSMLVQIFLPIALTKATEHDCVKSKRNQVISFPVRYAKLRVEKHVCIYYLRELSCLDKLCCNGIKLINPEL